MNVHVDHFNSDLGSVAPGDNWAVLVSSSKYWFNYRHLANTLTMYQLLKLQGFDDDHIILMDALDAVCDDRNMYPGEIYSSLNGFENIFRDVEIDFKGNEVTIDAFVHLLLGTNGRTDTNHNNYITSPSHRQLKTNEASNVLLFMSGHGGDEFFKFRDMEELDSSVFSRLIHRMSVEKRFAKLLVILETCQAETMASFINPIDTPNVTFIGSSKKGENSYSYQNRNDLGIAVIDRFTMSLSQFFEKKNSKHGTEKASLHELVHSMNPHFLYSHVFVTSTLKQGQINHKEIDLRDYFTSSSQNSLRREDELFEVIDFEVSTLSEEPFLSRGIDWDSIPRSFAPTSRLFTFDQLEQNNRFSFDDCLRLLPSLMLASVAVVYVFFCRMPLHRKRLFVPKQVQSIS